MLNFLSPKASRQLALVLAAILLCVLVVQSLYWAGVLPPSSAKVAEAPAPATADTVPASLSRPGYTLDQVVVLSRHNIRAPLSGGDSSLGKMTPHEWYAWSSNPSELSLRGGVLETEMGQYFCKWLEQEE